MNYRHYVFVTLRFYIAFVFVLFASTSEGASFNCSAERLSRIEIQICENPALSKKDDELSAVYKDALHSSATSKKVLRSQQRDWIAHTRNACENQQCLLEAYTQRINQIKKQSGNIDALTTKSETIPSMVFGKYVIKTPTCIWQTDREICDKFHWDTIAIEKRSLDSAYVSIETKRINSHGCAFSGIGRWDGDALRVFARPKWAVIKPSYIDQDTKWDSCQISIRIDGDVATYYIDDDTGGYCNAAFCSARGYLTYPDKPAIWHRKK